MLFYSYLQLNYVEKLSSQEVLIEAIWSRAQIAFWLVLTPPQRLFEFRPLFSSRYFSSNTSNGVKHVGYFKTIW
jgi:hypothetical protein